MGDDGGGVKALGTSQPALVIGGVNPAGRKKRASFPPSAGKLPPSHASSSGNNSNNAGDAPHGLSDAEKAKIHGKINGAKSLVASEKMRAYLDNRARKQREAMERRYGVAPSSSNGGSNIAPDGSVLSPKLSRPREAHPLTLGVGDEVKRAAAIAVDAGIRACTPESSAILAQGLEGVDAMLSNGGSSQLSTRDFTLGQHGASYNTNASTGKTFDGFNPDGGGNAMPRVSPPRAAGFGTAKGSATRGLGLLKPPPPNNRSPANNHQRGAKPKPPLSNRRPAPIRPPSSVGSDDDINGIDGNPEATPTIGARVGGRFVGANRHQGTGVGTPSANDPLLDPNDVDSPGDFPSPAPSAAARYIGRPRGLHVTSPAAFGGVDRSADSTPGLTPSDGGMARRGFTSPSEGGHRNNVEWTPGHGRRSSPGDDSEVRQMKLPTLSDVEDACDRHGGHDGYDSPDDSFPDDQPNGKYGTGTGAATSNQTTPAPGLGLRSVAPSPRSEALRLEEEHLAAAKIQANARGHMVRARMERERGEKLKLALAAKEMEEVNVYNDEDNGGDGDDVDALDAERVLQKALLTGSGKSVEALQRSVSDAVRGVNNNTGGSDSNLSADDTLARAADALTLSLTGSLPSDTGGDTGRSHMDVVDENGDGAGMELRDLDTSYVSDLSESEKAAVMQMQASARDLLLKGTEPSIAEMSETERSAVAKMQASAKLHLARSE